MTKTDNRVVIFLSNEDLKDIDEVKKLLKTNSRSAAIRYLIRSALPWMTSGQLSIES